MPKNLLLILFIIIPFLLNGQKLKSISKTFSNNDAIELEYTVLKKKKHVKHGAYKKYFENGQIKLIGRYDNNKKEGAWKEYDFSGELRRTKKYENGKLVSADKHGIWKEVNKNGKPYFFDYDNKERVLPQIPLLVSYPSKARESNIAGIVEVKVVLDDQCEIKELRIVKNLGGEFDKEAIKGIENYIEKLKYYEEDCKGFEKTITIEFKSE